MNAFERKSEWGRATGAALGLGALLVTVGCGTRDATGVSAQSLNASPAGLPVVVTCEPHQRTLVRPVVLNGATVSQVECVAAGQLSTTQAPLRPEAQQAYVPVRATTPAYSDLGDARVVPVARPVTRQDKCMKSVALLCGRRAR